MNTHWVEENTNFIGIVWKMEPIRLLFILGLKRFTEPNTFISLVMIG